MFLLGALPAAASAAPAWTCGSSAGWLSAGGQRVDAPGVGGSPCPTSRVDAGGVTGAPGKVIASGSVAADGGASSQTTDTRRPSATVSAASLSIHNSDDSLVVNASKLNAQATGSCDANRVPTFASSGSPGSVTLNGRPIDTSRDYTEPGLGANGAPLFGQITIHFNEVSKTDTDITRRAIHVIVTDRDGKVVFEGVGGEVSAGRDGAVCDPPPVCPPGQEPREGKCVDVSVTPLPQPPAGTPQAPGNPSSPGSPPAPAPVSAKGCKDADARAGQVSARRLTTATLCLLDNVRHARHLGRLRLSTELSRAAIRHAADMLKRRFFAHTGPSGPTLVDRVLRSGYMKRFGAWTLGENLGWGWKAAGTPRAIVIGWMRSPAHKRNILFRKFRDVGIAVVAGDPLGHRSRSLLYVTDFGGFQLFR